MKPSSMAAAAVLTLSSVTFMGAQAPASSGLIRHAAVGQGTLLVRSDGSVIAWGQSPGGMIPTPTVIELPGKALRVAVGGALTGGFSGYALLENGTVVSWGDNDEGQLGNGARGANVALGTYPKRGMTPSTVTGLDHIIDIGAGTKHAVALHEDGTVSAWGRRDDGTVGDGDTLPAGSLRVLSAMAPVRVPGLEGITKIAIGPNHNLALRRDGRVMAWGSNRSGELGVGSRVMGWTPVMVAGLDNVVEIAAGSAGSHGISGAVREDGTVWMWGSGTSAGMAAGQGALSPDDAGGRNLLPIQVKGFVNARQLAIGGGNVAVLLADGSLRMWGHNGYGETGASTPGSYATRPVRTPLAKVAAVYLGPLRSRAVLEDGTFWIWGFGQSTVKGVLGQHLKVPTRLDLP
jgi:alpha-tubulin suppressor-like RCC1 family protein